MKKQLRLWDIPRDSKMKLMISDTEKLEDCTFKHLDGMYSLIVRDSDNAPVHLRGDTPLELKDGFYYMK